MQPDSPTKPKVLIAMVGLPRSGKTAWARAAADANGWPIVCPDAIRYALHGQRFIDLAEPVVWSTAKLMVRSLFLAGHDYVILDATNTTRRARDEWRSPMWHLRFLHITTSAEECHRRAIALNDEYIRPHIDRMAAQFEALGEDEVFFGQR